MLRLAAIVRWRRPRPPLDAGAKPDGLLARTLGLFAHVTRRPRKARAGIDALTTPSLSVVPGTPPKKPIVAFKETAEPEMSAGIHDTRAVRPAPGPRCSVKGTRDTYVIRQRRYRQLRQASHLRLRFEPRAARNFQKRRERDPRKVHRNGNDWTMCNFAECSVRTAAQDISMGAASKTEVAG